jgi:hypothetical protein
MAALLSNIVAKQLQTLSDHDDNASAWNIQQIIADLDWFFQIIAELEWSFLRL